MARRGTFGRAPRAVPSLTNTLVSIAREEQAQRDQAIMDAWKNGGEFEGNKVTDEMALAYWKGRLKGVSKDDVAYDIFNNSVQQLEYSIAESKQSVLYKQGKISAGKMASFYLNWAKKVPKNSEFYRVLQRDAADLMQQQKGQSASDAARAKEVAYQKWVSGVQKRTYAGADYMMNGLRQAFITGRLIDGGQDFINFDSLDPTRAKVIFDKINAGDDTVIFWDPAKGKNVTSKEFLDGMREVDANFSGTVGLGTLNRYVNMQREGAKQIMQKAKKTGHVQDYRDAESLNKYGIEFLRQANAYPTSEAYIEAITERDRVLKDPSSGPKEIGQARTNYEGELAFLLKDPNLDARTRQAIQDELDGKGTLNLAQDFTGFGDYNNPYGEGHQDERSTGWAQDLYAQVDALQEAVDSGEYIWTPGTYDPTDHSFEPDPKGQSFSAVPVGEIQSMGLRGAVTGMLPDGNGGLQMTAVQMQPVYAKVLDPRDPTGQTELKPSGDRVPIAWVATTTIGGERVQNFVLDATTADGKTTPRFAKDGIQPWSQDGFVRLDEGDDGSLSVVYNAPISADGTFTPSAGYTVTPGKNGEQIITYDQHTVGLDPSFDATNAASNENLSSSFTVSYMMSVKENANLFDLYKNNTQVDATVWADSEKASGAGMNPDGTYNPGNPQLRASLVHQYDGLVGGGTTIATMVEKPDPAEGKSGMVTFLADQRASGRYSGGTIDARTGKPYDALRQGYSGTMPNPSQALASTQFSALGNAWKPGSKELATALNTPAATGPQFGLKLPGVVQQQPQTIITPAVTNMVNGFTPPKATQVVRPIQQQTQQGTTGSTNSAYASAYTRNKPM